MASSTVVITHSVDPSDAEGKTQVTNVTFDGVSFRQLSDANTVAARAEIRLLIRLLQGAAAFISARRGSVIASGS